MRYRNRILAYNAQEGRCCYCKWPMWEKQYEPEDAATTRMQWLRDEDEQRNVRLFECTAEHSERRVDGGSNLSSNIAAACAWCNSSRGDKTPDETAGAAIALNQMIQVGRDNETDDAIFAAMSIRRDFYFKFPHFLFVRLPWWIAMGHAMELGDTGQPGRHFNVLENTTVVFPNFSEDALATYKKRQEIIGSVILLQSTDHLETLQAKLSASLI